APGGRRPGRRRPCRGAEFGARPGAPPPFPPPPPLPPPLVPAPAACCGVVLMVADMAAPFPSRTTWTGLVRPKFLQPRLSKDMSSRLARKVNRLSPTSATGDGPAAKVAWLAI